MSPDPFAVPHRRRNPLTGAWVLVSPGRTERPWLGRREPDPGAGRPRYDPACYLCPGARRAGGAVNPPYTGCYVFDNDFPALRDEGPVAAAPADELFQAQPVGGVCRVVCFSPRHDLSLAQLSPEEIGAVIDVWAAETEALGRRYRWVQVFENKGELMGCSNPHPHGQIWASSTLPQEAAAEDERQRRYRERHGRNLLQDYARREAGGERLVLENPGFLVLVPFWAVWPFETLILPRAPVSGLPQLSAEDRRWLAQALARLMRGYDRLFETSFPYSFGWHGAPHGEPVPPDHWQLHGHVYPPLLRSATVKKFMVGYEMLAEPQRDLTPEAAAARLRAVMP